LAAHVLNFPKHPVEGKVITIKEKLFVLEVGSALFAPKEEGQTLFLISAILALGRGYYSAVVGDRGQCTIHALMEKRGNGYIASIGGKHEILVIIGDLGARRLPQGALQRIERRLMGLPPTERHSLLFQLM